MTGQPACSRYPDSAILLHWFMLALIVAVYACILLRVIYPRGGEIREALKAWHFMLGLGVLAIAILRGALRVFVWKAPPVAPAPPRWLAGLAIAAHAAIYVWMIAMPLAGWIVLSAEGDPVPFWGLTLPPLTGVDETLAGLVESLHETGGTLGYFLLGLHAAAALFHHYILKDNTFRRILPPARRRPAP